jgi:hypothetical protein
VAPDHAADAGGDERLDREVVSLFHRLNNQLGVILANSELLESKLADETQRVRAAQVVTGALEAIGTVQHLKRAVGLNPTNISKAGN